jgi:trehalose/maltose transport system permease protein
MVTAGSSIARQRVRSAWTFLAPSLVVLALVAGWPLLRTFWFSLTDANLTEMKEARFVGFANYQELFADSLWWQSVWTTFRFALISVVLETALGLMIAMVLNARFAGRGLLRAAVLAPWAIPTVVSARMWGWMFNDFYGVVNEVLFRLNLVEEAPAWTADPALALWSVIAVDVWKTTPFMTLLILAALQTLPEDVYEAAQIDGARPTRVFLQITLPLIRGPLMVAVIFRMLDALRVFDLFYILTSNSNETLPMAGYARRKMFELGEMGAGAAAASTLFALIALFTVVYLSVGRVRVDPEAT